MMSWLLILLIIGLILFALTNIHTFVGLIVLGLLYQFVSTKLDREEYQSPGKLVSVGDHRLHINCSGTGNAGPTIVLDSGLGMSSLDWSKVQPEIAKFARVCSYDRAGYGWSEEGKNPRTSERMVEELHTLLHNASVPTPYVLVGHSLGGTNMLLFAEKYPGEVAGLVLVDAVHGDQIKEIATTIEPDYTWVEKCINNRFIKTYCGGERFLYQFMPHYFGEHVFEPSIQKIMILQAVTLRFANAFDGEYASFGKSLSQVNYAPGLLKELPLVVISATQNRPVDWQEQQKKLVSLSSKSSQVMADKSDHFIERNQPELIVEAVRTLIQK